MTKETKKSFVDTAFEKGERLRFMAEDKLRGKKNPTIIGAAIAVFTLITSALTLKNYLKKKKAKSSK